MIKACSRSSFDPGSPAWKAGMLPRRYDALVFIDTNTMFLFSLFSIWKETLTKADIKFKNEFLIYIMSPFLRSHVAITEPYQTKQNLAMMTALPDPILIMDPLQISLEYLELLHADEKITLLHIGDPTFKQQFITEAKV